MHASDTLCHVREDLKDEQLDGMKIRYVKTMNEVLPLVLEKSTR